MKSKFGIIKNKKVFYIISLLILAVGIGGLIVNGGFNFDVDFTGGTAIAVDTKITLDRAELDSIEALAGEVLGFAPSVVQKSGEGDTTVVIKTRPLETTERDSLFQAIKEKYALEADAPDSSENFSATVGRELREKAIISIIVASLLMMIYIWFRFELRSGLAAIVTMMHDVMVLLTFYAVFQFPINNNFIAVMLTIVGYSINATIIIFDRLRENRKFVKNKESFEVTAEKSIWQTAARQINTTITTLFTIVMVFILGVTSVRNFALPLIIGIAAGLYSSMFLAAPLWVNFKDIRIGDKTAKIK